MKDNLKWYALKVTANQERKVKDYIEKRLKIKKLEKEVPSIVVPTEKYLTISSKGKKIIKEKLILPGYLLIHTDLNHGEIKPLLITITGVYGFLNMDDRTDTPIPMRDSEITRFIKVYEEQEEMTWDFEIGDRVKLLNGPFSGFEGSIHQLDLHKKSVVVMVMIFGRETSVEINLEMIEKIAMKKVH